MAQELWTNNAKSLLASGITNSATSLTCTTGEGALFPIIGSGTGNFFFATLSEGSSLEIVLVVARSSDTFTIRRGQQGTTGTTFTSAARLELRPTAGSFENLQRESKLVMVSGFTGSDYLNAAGLNGSATTTISALVRLPTVAGIVTNKAIVSSGSLFTQGYLMTVSGNRPFVEYADGSFSKFSSGGADPNWPGVGTTPSTSGFVDWKTAVMSLRWDGTLLSLFINGLLFRQTSPGSGGAAPGSNGMFMGVNVDLSTPFTGGGLAGVAYCDSVDFTDDEVITWQREVMEANDVVEGALAWDAVFSFKQLGYKHGDSVPSSMPDILGNVDVDLTGSLVFREERARWL